MATTHPDLMTLAERANETFPHADVPTAVIAVAEPRDLRYALGQLWITATNNSPARAEFRYKMELRKSAPGIPSESLAEAARAALEAEDNPGLKDSIRLARDINRRRSRLAFPMRATIGVIAGLAFGTFIGEEIYPQHLVAPTNLTAQEKVFEKYARESAIIGGVLGGISAGILGFSISGTLTNFEAGRRARKIASKQQRKHEAV